MPVDAVMRSHKRTSRSNPSQLADVPFQATTSTLACARSSAARRISSSSNWRCADSDNAISVTLKREKCAETPAMPASIAFVIGSSAVLDEGVSMPSRTGRVILQAFVGKSGSDEGGYRRPGRRFLDRQFATVINQVRADQQRNAGGGEEHQCQKVRAGSLDDESDDQWRQYAGNIAAEIHAAAEKSGFVATRESRGNGPIHSAPPQKE